MVGVSRPVCVKCSKKYDMNKMIRLYIRDKNKWVPVGWFCPLCRIYRDEEPIIYVNWDKVKYMKDYTFWGENLLETDYHTNCIQTNPGE